jgi:hypothetical protein
MIRGKTSEEALSLSGEELSSPLGPLPPMKIHCAQLVEDALRSALSPEPTASPSLKDSSPTPAAASSLSLADQLLPTEGGKVKITLLTNTNGS